MNGVLPGDVLDVRLLSFFSPVVVQLVHLSGSKRIRGAISCIRITGRSFDESTHAQTNLHGNFTDFNQVESFPNFREASSSQ
jgi:hypothetical protein